VVAETRYFNAIFLGCLEDGEVVFNLVGFVIDEDLYLLGGEGRVGSEEGGQCGQTQQHQLI
jgi:hypothetical protein